MDMGDIGTHTVIVTYQRTSSGLLSIHQVLWEGMDLMDRGLISEEVEEVLLDECRQNEWEETVCAAESEWDRKREERLIGEMA